MKITRSALCCGLILSILAPVASAQDLPVQYREKFADSFPIREKQHRQMKAFLDAFPKRENIPAARTFRLDYASPAAYANSLRPAREHLLAVKGLPPALAVENPTPRFELVGRDQVADIYRVRTEVFKGVDAYALYMVPRGLQKKAPVIIAVHGGSGCPEAVCDLDTRVNYRSFGREAARRGFIVYAPGILMNVSYAEPPDPSSIPGADRREMERQAGALGTDTRDLQMFQIIEGVKAVVKARAEADGERIGMTGLSMGGGFTLSTPPLWDGIKVAVCSAGFRGGENEDASPPAQIEIGGEARRTDMVTLIAPRPLMIQSGSEDTVAPLEAARRGVPRVQALYNKLGIGDKFEFNIHSGGHVFENEAIFRFFDAHLK